MDLDDERRYRAVQSRDERFDGWFVTAVRTTGIYCRPSCPAITPKRGNVEFFATAATAQQHGYRACKRCRPDATPGSPEWNSRADVVGRAMRLIADGLVDREGTAGLARRLGYSPRQVTRLITSEVGCGPLALARAQRAQTARILIETTTMPITDVAFAAGFSSVRQFNDTIREVFAAAPRALRAATTPAAGGPLTLRLPYRAPLDSRTLLAYLGARAIPGVEHFDGSTYRRSLRLDQGAGVVALTPVAGSVSCTLWLDRLADAQAAVQRCRRLLDLDADPLRVDEHLGDDPLLRALVARRPGLRAPGHPDGTELLVRAVLGQQVSVRGARTLATRLVYAAGEPLPAPTGEIRALFPDAAAIAALDPRQLPLPAARAAAVVAACREVAEGRLVLDAGSDRAATGAALEAMAGIGPWTAGYVVMRALGDPDVFLAGDLVARKTLAAIGRGAVDTDVAQLARRWSPWRSYALHHLWAAAADPVPGAGAERNGRRAVARPSDARRRSSSAEDDIETILEVDMARDRTRTAALSHASERSWTAASAPLARRDAGEALHHAIVDSPLGPITIVAGAAGVRSISWPADGDVPIPAPSGSVEGPTPVLEEAVRQLAEYFTGDRREFDLPLDPVGSDFQRRAWEVLRTIPYGRTMSYGEQAAVLGDARKARAVGAANGRNPIGIVVLCHRVVGAGGKLTGYAGGLHNKARLLDLERGVARLGG